MRPARRAHGDQIELLPHAADTWAVTLDTTRALELRDALTELTLGVEPRATPSGAGGKENVTGDAGSRTPVPRQR